MTAFARPAFQPGGSAAAAGEAPLQMRIAEISQHRCSREGKQTTKPGSFRMERNPELRSLGGDEHQPANICAACATVMKQRPATSVVGSNPCKRNGCPTARTSRKTPCGSQLDVPGVLAGDDLVFQSAGQRAA